MGSALRFLTVLPVPGRHAVPGQRALGAFPLVGLVIGLAWLAVASRGETFVNTGTAAALILVVDALLTGALHLDATADVADGVASRRRGAEAVAVMRDSAVGAVGAAVLVLVCLVRYSALVGLVGFPLRTVAGPLLAAPVTGRLAMVLLLAALAPRQDGSLAAALPRPAPGAVGAALGTTVALALALQLVFGTPLLVPVGAGVATAAAYGLWWRRRFGGLTGDGAGAGGLLAETLVLLVAAALAVR